MIWGRHGGVCILLCTHHSCAPMFFCAWPNTPLFVLFFLLTCAHHCCAHVCLRTLPISSSPPFCFHHPKEQIHMFYTSVCCKFFCVLEGVPLFGGDGWRIMWGNFIGVLRAVFRNYGVTLLTFFLSFFPSFLFPREEERRKKRGEEEKKRRWERKRGREEKMFPLLFFPVRCC